MDFRSRPKGEYLRHALWQELYDLSKHWRSEFDFYRDEIAFLYILLNDHMTDLTHEMSLAELKELHARLGKIDKTHHHICSMIKKQIHDLKGLLENDICQDEQEFRDEHALLEDMYTKFQIQFRQLKRNIFYNMEQVLKLKKKNHLLS